MRAKNKNQEKKLKYVMVLFVIIHFILEINAGEGREDHQGKKIELTTEISMHMRAHKGRKKKQNTYTKYSLTNTQHA